MVILDCPVDRDHLVLRVREGTPDLKGQTERKVQLEIGVPQDPMEILEIKEILAHLVWLELMALMVLRLAPQACFVCLDPSNKINELVLGIWW